MTVGRLIEILKKFPPNRRVFVTGYEGGYEEEFYVYPEKAIIDYNNVDGYCGPHELLDTAIHEIEGKQLEDVIFIDRSEQEVPLILKD